MAPEINGTWYSVFRSPAGNDHYFTLTLKNAVGAMHLHQRQSRGAVVEVDYRVHVESCDRFVALLAKDVAEPSQGVNTMVLQISADGSAMSGHLTWNSVSHKVIQVGEVEWSRARPSHWPTGAGQA